MPSLSDLHVGDKVQVIPGTRDDSLYGNRGVLIATRYTSNGNLFMTITQKGFPRDPSADYLVLSYQGIVITATRARYIASNYVCTHKKPEAKPKPSKPITVEPLPDPKPPTSKIAPDPIPLGIVHVTKEEAQSWYMTPDNTSEWVTSQPVTIHANVKYADAIPAQDHTMLIGSEGSVSSGIKDKGKPLTRNELREKGPNSILKQNVIRNPSFKSNLTTGDVINAYSARVQNAYGYPSAKSITNYNTQNFIVRKYEYETNNNVYLNGRNQSLKEALGEFRKLYGLPIHGEEAIGKYMKYFLYNRYKVPDINNGQSRMFTHVFFTRPDLNILQNDGSHIVASNQCKRHTESTMLWHKNPELFKLLVDKRIAGDRNNFNFLLSNNITQLSVINEELNTTTHGKSWHGYEMKYGTNFTGRQTGTITVTFNETRDLAIHKLLKLWMLYIDNVSRGAWSPSYNLTQGGGNGTFGYNFADSHAYTRTLDYAASMYLIKVAENGQDILYWTKYYGIFPITTGSEAFSFDGGKIETTPQLNITFQYMMKRDMNPVNLVEFNANAGTINPRHYVPQYNEDTNSPTNPFVGTPYIEMKFPEVDTLKHNDVERGKERATLRLRFDSDYIESASIKYRDMFYDNDGSVRVTSTVKDQRSSERDGMIVI